MEHGFAVAADVAPEVVAASASTAEELGYSSFWTNHPGPTDGIAALGFAARATTRIELGVGVVPLHVRPPASIVDGVRAAALPLDRLLLGVGSPNPRALARLREGVDELRAELGCRLIAAALGPRMCHLAGSIADGVLLNWLTPEHARRSAEWVRAGAEEAGQEPPKLYAYVRFALGPGASERVEEERARYAAFPMYTTHFARMEADPGSTAVAAGVAGEIGSRLAEWQGAVDEVVLRALPADPGLEGHLELLHAAATA